MALVIGEAFLPFPRCAEHEHAILVKQTVACGDWITKDGVAIKDGNDELLELNRLRNEMAAIRLFFNASGDVSIIEHLRTERARVVEYKAQRDMLMEASGPLVREHRIRLDDLDEKVEEIREAIHKAGIFV